MRSDLAICEVRGGRGNEWLAAAAFVCAVSSVAHGQPRSYAPPAAQASVAERAIRTRRESSNQAIAKHDTAGIAAIFAADVIVITSRSVKTVGRAENVQAFADQFRDRPDVVYRRTPDGVGVFAPWGMASERGTWAGSWTQADGKISIGGSYFAKWRLINGAWFVEAETYVPERCTGGTYCTTVP